MAIVKFSFGTRRQEIRVLRWLVKSFSFQRWIGGRQLVDAGIQLRADSIFASHSGRCIDVERRTTRFSLLQSGVMAAGRPTAIKSIPIWRLSDLRANGRERRWCGWRIFALFLSWPIVVWCVRATSAVGLYYFRRFHSGMERIFRRILREFHSSGGLFEMW